MRKPILLILAGLVAVTTAASAIADTGHDPAPTTSKSPMTSNTCVMNANEQVRAALITLHQSNLDEIALGKLAQARASSPDVKQFANHMVQDHTNADAKLTDLARRQNIDLAASVDEDPLRAAAKDTSQELSRRLSTLNGPQFDTNYIAPQALLHQLVLSVVDEAGTVATNADIKSFLGDTRRVVSEHHQRAAALVDRLSLPATPVGGGPAGSAMQMAPEPGPSAKPSAPMQPPSARPSESGKRP